MKVIEVEDFWWKYITSKEWILQGINFDVERGEFIGLIGPSGAGKTTLCLALAGIIPNEIRGDRKGRVKIFGKDSSTASVSELAQHIGVVFQDPDTQFVTMRVIDEVAFPLENFGVSREEIMKRVKEALEFVSMWEYREKFPHELSGGQKQRVAVASMLARQPELLILDEPTSDLDPVGKKEVFSVLDKLRDEKGITVIVVDHNTDDLVRYVDRFLVINKGKVVAEGDARTVFSKVEELEGMGVRTPQAAKLFIKVRGEYQPLNGQIPLTVDESIRALSEVRSYLKVESVKGNSAMEDVTREPAIKFIETSYEYEDGTLAVNDVNFSVLYGEFLAIIGPNGSGKTTLAKLMTGIYKPTKGRVEIFGEDSRRLSTSTVATKVGYVYQNPDHQLFCTSVYEEIVFALKQLKLEEREIGKRVEEALTFMGLNGFEETQPFFLSKGERQRLAIAAVLAMGPQVLIVDEPTTGQDELHSRKIMEVLVRLKQAGKTIIVITHDLSLVSRYAERVAVMHNGKLVAVGSVRDIIGNLSLMESVGLEPPPIVRISQFLLGEPALMVEEVKLCGY